MDHLDAVPQFVWPAHIENLEDDLIVTGDTITTTLQSDQSITETPIITKIFTSATDFLSKTTENITSTNRDTFNITESTTEQSINIQEKSFPKIKEMLGSAVSTEILPLQSSIAHEPSVEEDPINFITEIFSNAVSTEKPPYSTSWEQPIATSKYPLIDTSEFGINMNTDSSRTIDTMKDILVEAISKEKGLFEGETTEEPISTTSTTITTLRDMFTRAMAKEKPLLVTAKTESAPIDFKTSTEKPLFETFSVAEPFFNINSGSTEKPFIQNTTIAAPQIEYSTNTNSAIDKMIDIFNESIPSENALFENYVSEQSLNDSSATTTNSTLETLKDMLSTKMTTEEPPIEFGPKSINDTIKMIVDGFNGSTQTEQSNFQTIFEKMKDTLSTTLATEEPSIDLSLNMKANNSMASPFLQTTNNFDDMKDTLVTQKSVAVFGQSTLEKMNDFLSTTEEASIEIGQVIKTNNTTDMMADVFNILSPTERPFELGQSTFGKLKDILSTTQATKESPIDFGLNTKTNSTSNIAADIFHSSTPIEQPFIQITSTSENIKEILLSTEEPPIELSQSTFEQLKDMLATTEATEEPSTVFHLGTKTNGTTDMIAEVFNRPAQESVTEFGHGTFQNMQDMLTKAEPSIDLRQRINTNSTINVIADVFNTSTPTEQQFFQTKNTSEKIQDMLLSTEEPPIELNQSTFEQLKDMLSMTESTDEPSIVFDLGTRTNSTTDMIAEVLNESTQNSVTKFGYSTFENMKDVLTKAEPSIDFSQSINTNGTIDIMADFFNTSTPIEQPFIQTTSTSEKIQDMLLSTEEPPIGLGQSTFEQLKDMLSTTESTEEPPIVFDVGTNTNGTTNMIAEVFNRSTLTEQPFFQSTSTLEKVKDTLTTHESVPEFGHLTFENMKDMLTKAEPSIDFRQSINTTSTIDVIADVFNTTSTENPFFQNRSTFEKIKDMLPTEEPSEELGKSTFQKMKEMLTTEESTLEFGRGIKSNTTDIIANIFDRSNSTHQSFVQDTKLFEKFEDVLATEKPSIDFGQGTNTKSIIDFLADIFNGTAPTQNPFIRSTTKGSSVKYGGGIFERIQDILSTTRKSPNQLGQSMNSNRSDLIENIFDGTTSTKQTFVQNTSILEKIKDMLSTTQATKPSTEFLTKTGEPLVDVVQSTKTNSTLDLMEEIFNKSSSTEQSMNLNNTFVTLKDMMSVSQSELSNNSNDTLALMEIINIEQTFEETINNNATSTSTGDLTGIFRSAEVQRKLNSAVDIVTTEMSTETPFTSSTGLPENSSIYFNNNATSNSTEIFRTDPSIFQSTINYDLMDPIENNTLSEDGISNSTRPLKKIFEDALSTISSNFSSTTREALGNADEQNQTDSWTVYIILGVILAILIILTVGGYIICRKYRKNHKLGGGYYVTHLKDYSDSSVKTISDSDTVNIRL